MINNSQLFRFLNDLKKDSSFLVYSWGDDLNELSNRLLFSSYGIDAVIYDRVNELN
jgi:hypothetical protein